MVTLAVAIGANAVVFGVLNALIIRPLHVPHAESLWGLERGNDLAVNQSYPDYLDLRERNRSFEDLAAYNVTGVGLDTGNNPSSSWIMEVTGNYFDALGIQPYLGRFFHSSDEHGPNSAPYIVLTYAFWHTHFQDDRGVVGRVVQLNKHPFTILGVAPPEFRGTLVFLFPDFWVPLVNQEQVEGVNVLNARGNRGILMVLGHLKAGVTPAQAVADLNSIGSYLEKTYPKDDGQMTFSLTRPGLTGDWLGGPLRAFLAGLMLLAGLILLAACANLGSLFAARAADRSRELAVPTRARIGPRAHSAATLYRSHADLPDRRRCGSMGQRLVVARAERMGAASHRPHPYPCKPRRKCLCSRFAVEFGERIPLWRGPGKAGASHRSISGHQVGIDQQHGAAGGSLSETCCSWCKLRSARCWSLLRWSPCADWCVRCTAVSVLSHGMRCWSRQL